ncbi:MAG: cytochrome c-type biogenesis protein [Gammaproteobacteria bacterium]|jgi:cytochrome c-type biogenesis protein CcmH
MIRVIWFLIFFHSLSFGEIELYKFDSTEEQNLFNKLTYEIGCPLCEGSNVSGSSSPIALDIKQFIYDEIKSGKKESIIKEKVSGKFGDEVLFSPPRNASTFLLYFFPIILIIFSMILLLRLRK